MAELIPSLSTCLRKMTSGERRFAQRLESHLENDYHCWYELPVGRKQRYTDFIILHPSRGLLFLEVKDWKIETIRSINKVSTEIFENGLPKTVANPLEQARQCTYQLINKLQRDPQLLIKTGDHSGKLVCPYGYGVVLANITRKQYLSANIQEVIPENLVICKDEMVENIDVEQFQTKLWNMFPYYFATKLTLPEKNRIRWHIFPEVRVNNPEQKTLFSCSDDFQIELPDIIRVMDMKQERLARSLGTGHRVIHGVAGSGKTMILAYRCAHLAEQLNKPILVLCYNKTLAAWLRGMVEDKGIGHKVNVHHFHEWCGEIAKIYNIKKPKSGPDYPNRLVKCIIEATDKGLVPSGQYGAILIDEGHDFEAEWLRLITQMVDPDTKSLLLLYDDAQSIYIDNKLDFSLSSVGIEARGRTTVLRINYRNTDEILKFAYKFASKYMTAKSSDEDHIPLLEPYSEGRHGPRPKVKIHPDFQSEIEEIAATFKRLHVSENIPWSDMCVTYYQNKHSKEIEAIFKYHNIPVQKTATSNQKENYDHKSSLVKLMTMHSSKGLEFPVVAVVGIGSLGEEEERKINDAKVLYVAMTRSTDRLFLTGNEKNEFMSELLGFAA